MAVLAEKETQTRNTMHDDFIAPSLDELDDSVLAAGIDSAKNGVGSAPRIKSENDSPWVDEIFSSDDLPLTEPDIEELDSMLGYSTDNAVNHNEIEHQLDQQVADAIALDEEETPSHQQPDSAADFFNNEDEGPIALSDEELEGIVSTLDEDTTDAKTATENTAVAHDAADIEFGDDFGKEATHLDLDDKNHNNQQLAGSHLDDDEQPFEFGSDSAEKMGAQAKQTEVIEDEPITLSTDELDNILGNDNADDHFNQPAADPDSIEDPSLSGELEELPDEIENDVMSSADALELEDGSLNLSLADDKDENLEEVPGKLPAQAIDEDDEPIALSSDELDNIMGDSGESEVKDDLDDSLTNNLPSSESGDLSLDGEGHDGLHDDLSFDDSHLHSDGLDLSLDDPAGETPLDKAPASKAIDEDDEPIALSSDELDNIMGDSEESEVTEDLGAPVSDALSGSETGDLSLDGEGHDGLHDGLSFDDSELHSDDMDLGLDDPASETPLDKAQASKAIDEDDEPIALSSDELDNIMGDSGESEVTEDLGAPVSDALSGSETGDLSLDGEGHDGLHDDLSFDDSELHSDDMDLGNLDVPASETPLDKAQASKAVDEDDEPIALSSDELDNIMGDSGESEVKDDLDDSLTNTLPSSETGDLSLDGEGHDGLHDDLSFDDSELPSDDMDLGNLDDPANETPLDKAQASKAIDEDDEPIALSSDELDNIMGDSGESEVTEDLGAPVSDALSGSETGDLSLDGEGHDGLHDGLSFDDSELHSDDTDLGNLDDPASETPLDKAQASKAIDEDDEPIALSSDELDNIMGDSGEGEATEDPDKFAAETKSPTNDFFNASEDEEVIALSADELDNIESIQEELPPFDSQPQVPLQPELGKGGDDFFNSTVEEPIALSDDELNGIVADIEKQSEPPAIGFDKHQALAEETSQELAEIPGREELRDVIGYLDNLLGELPEEVIEKFSQSEHFKLYQKIMDKLGL